MKHPALCRMEAGETSWFPRNDVAYSEPTFSGRPHEVAIVKGPNEVTVDDGMYVILLNRL